MSNHQRKETGELSQSVLKVILLLIGNFHTYIRIKDVMTSLFVFILSSGNWMYFPEENIIFCLKYFCLDCVFISSTGDGREQCIPVNDQKRGQGYSIISSPYKRSPPLPPPPPPPPPPIQLKTFSIAPPPTNFDIIFTLYRIMCGELLHFATVAIYRI